MTIDRDRLDRRVVMDCANTSVAGVSPPRIFVSSGGSLEDWEDAPGSARNKQYANQIMEIVSSDAGNGFQFEVHDIFGAALNGTGSNATYYLGDEAGLDSNSYEQDTSDPNSVAFPYGIQGTMFVDGAQRDHPALARFDVDGDHLFGIGDDPRVTVHRFQRDQATLRWVLIETI